MHELLKNADAVIIAAGAGMGVDSGLPDFRGNEGFWKAYPPMQKLGLSFSEMANPEWFERKPELAWGFYGHRLKLYRETIPHKGFEMLLKYAEKLPLQYFVYTSNVDGQFQKAGFSENRIYEIHGSIHQMQCSIPCSSKPWLADEYFPEIDSETFLEKGDLPVCIHCGELARPNILMFSDWHWIDTSARLQSESLSKYLQMLKNERARVLVLEFGAGKSVPSVRMFSNGMVNKHGASLIRINPRDFDVPANQKYLQMGALAGIKFLLE